MQFPPPITGNPPRGKAICSTDIQGKGAYLNRNAAAQR